MLKWMAASVNKIEFATTALSHSRRSQCEPYSDHIKEAWELGAGYAAIRNALLETFELNVPASSLINFINVRVQQGRFGKQGCRSAEGQKLLRKHGSNHARRVPKPKVGAKKAATSVGKKGRLVAEKSAVASTGESAIPATEEFPWPGNIVEITELATIAQEQDFPLKKDGEIDMDRIFPPVKAEQGASEYNRFLLAISLQLGFRKSGDRHSHTFASNVRRDAEKRLKKARSAQARD